MAATKKVSGSSGSKSGTRAVSTVKPPARTKRAAPGKAASPAKKSAGITKGKTASVQRSVASPKGKSGGKKTVKKSSAKKIPAYKLKRYKCRLCGYIYSPLRGEPHHGIPAGTPFEDLPEDYVCPVCGYRDGAGSGNGVLTSGRPPGTSVRSAGTCMTRSAVNPTGA